MAVDRLCPSCGDLIAADAPGCRRCGYDTTAGPAPGPTAPLPPQPHVPPANASPYSAAYAQARVFTHNPDDYKTPWQEIAFKVMAVVILVHGLLDILGGVLSLTRTSGGTGGYYVAYGGVTLLIAVGLLAEWELASIVLRLYCWISIIIFAFFGMIFMLAAVSGIVAMWLAVLVIAVLIAIYGFMIYLVNEVGQA